MKNIKGFTYIEVLFSVVIICIFIGIYMHAEQYIYSQRQQWDEVDKMTMTAQGVMDAYRTEGKAAALTFGQDYAVDITETQDATYTSLKKVTVTVTPKVSGMSSITLVTYHSS